MICLRLTRTSIRQPRKPRTHLIIYSSILFLTRNTYIKITFTRLHLIINSIILRLTVILLQCFLQENTGNALYNNLNNTDLTYYDNVYLKHNSIIMLAQVFILRKTFIFYIATSSIKDGKTNIWYRFMFFPQFTRHLSK